MPLVYQEPALPSRRDPFGRGLPAFEPGPSLGEVIGSAFRQENIIGSTIDLMRDQTRVGPRNPEPDYDLFKEEGFAGSAYEQDHLDSFVGVRSQDEYRLTKSRIDRETKDRENIAAGGFAGVVAAIGAGILDPTVLLPGGAIIRTGRGAISMGRTALAGGAAVGAGVAGQEAVLQGTQELRTGRETVFAVGTATILGSLLGGAAAGLGKAEISRIEGQLEAVRQGMADPDYVPWSPREAGAAVPTEGSSGRIAGALGAERALSGLGPVTRAQQSIFETTPRAMAQMSDAGLTMRENIQGIVTTEGGTVENRIRMREGGLGRAIEIADTAYAKYFHGTQSPSTFQRMGTAGKSEFSRWTGRLGGRMTAQEFYTEVGRAMSRSDTHAVPEVAEAARAYRENVFEPLGQEARSLGLLPENIQVVGAESYITRVYNHQRIVAEGDRWKRILVDWFKAERDQLAKQVSDVEERAALGVAPDGRGAQITEKGREFADMSDGEINALVDEVTDTILGNNAFRLSGVDIVQGPRGPLKERVLRVPDRLIEDFLERDVRKVAKVYTRSMAADVELTAKFGDPRLEGTLKTLADEKNAKAAAATSDKERVRIQTAYERDRRDLEAVRDRLRGIYGMPDNPAGMGYRAAKIASAVNYMRLLGGMTISAIPDIARPIMVYGLTSTFRDGWRPFITNLKTARLAAKEVKLAGTGLDMALDSRTQAIADLFQDFQQGSKFERALEGASSRFGVVSLMAPWNAAMKQVTGVMVMSNVLRATRAVAEGRASSKQIERLAASGISDDMARRISRQFETGGEVQDGVFLPNTEDWTDTGARNAFRTAIVRDVDRIIITPGVERPLWTSATWGRLMGQFKAFAFSSIQKTLMAGLQQRDAAFINGSLVALSLGAMAFYTKSYFAGDKAFAEAQAGNWRQWAFEAVDNSGLLGIISDVNNISEKFTRGRVGASYFTGATARRYQSRSDLGALLGPTYDLVAGGMQITGSAFEEAFPDPEKPDRGGWTASSTHAVRKLMPFQNLFFLRRTFDEIEKGVNSTFGVPERAN